MVRPTMGRPCCWRTAATVDESTPPDMATATRPGWTSLQGSEGSNCAVDCMTHNILATVRARSKVRTPRYKSAEVAISDKPGKAGEAGPLRRARLRGRRRCRQEWCSGQG